MEEQQQNFENKLAEQVKILERERETWNTKLETIVASQMAALQSLEKMTVERDRLLRDVKRMRASILLTSNTYPGGEENSLILLAEEQARLDYLSLDLEPRSDHKKEKFESGTGKRVGKVKYREWLQADKSTSLDKDNLNN
jgi:hypothetical protein